MEMMYRFTSLARVLDPRIPTNLAIIGLSALGGIIAGALTLFSTGDLGRAVADGFWKGAAVFIAWVLTREVDPDHPYAAFVSAAVALVFPTQPLRLLPLVMLIVLTRILNRIVGLPAKPTDSIVGLVTAGAAALTGDVGAAFVAAGAFALDALLREPLRWQLVFAILAAGVGVFAWTQNAPDGSLSTNIVIGMAAALVVYAIALLTTRTIETKADIPEHSVDAGRVQASMVLLPAMGILGALWSGDAGVYGLLPVWAAMAGAGLYRLYTLAAGR